MAAMSQCEKYPSCNATPLSILPQGQNVWAQDPPFSWAQLAGISVSISVICLVICMWGRQVIEAYFTTYELDLVHQWKANCLHRKKFWSTGMNDLLCIDQHDKWKKYGLVLHTGIEPFVVHIQWLQVWWTNSNPQLILNYYFDMVESFGCEYLMLWMCASLLIVMVYSYAAGLSKQSWPRELWFGKQPYDFVPLTWWIIKRRPPTLLDVNEEEHSSWNQLV